MARWGEGDPRWLVEERPDAINVNNWHWTEKDASSWSIKRLSELFIGMKVETATGYCEITEILKCEGDAIAINRRGKLIFFYEWNLEMKWVGASPTDNAVVEGKVTILYFTEEQDIKDTDVLVSYDRDQSNEELFGNIMEHQGQERILELLNVYVTELKEDFAKDLILPSQYSSPQMSSRGAFSINQNIIPEQKDNVAKNEIGTGDLQSTETFKCTAEEIYQALTVKELVQIFTQRECVLECREGGRFELFEGNVHGYFLKLQPFHTIMMKWRVSTWPENHFSDVVINVLQKMDCTELKLSQFGVPNQEIENTREGWKRYYWDNIKKTLRFGAFLF